LAGDCAYRDIYPVPGISVKNFTSFFPMFLLRLKRTMKIIKRRFYKKLAGFSSFLGDVPLGGFFPDFDFL
jgi:hypothetical protein